MPSDLYIRMKIHVSKQKALYAEFIAAYRELSDSIFRYCYARLSNREKALEVMQETFMNAWNYLVQGNSITYLKAFLYRTANNLIVDQYRKKKPLSLDELHEKGFDPWIDIEESLRYAVEGKHAMQSLSLINKKYHEAIALRYVEGLSIKEISDIINETQNNVSVRIHRGLKDLRTILSYGRKKAQKE
jgi:RNA polymerase sigma-70 factor (ECF subfamily)